MTQKESTARLLKNEPLSRYTSWRVGGIADQVYIPANIKELSAFLNERDRDEAIHFVGLGSNLLVRDGGVRGLSLIHI